MKPGTSCVWVPIFFPSLNLSLFLMLLLTMFFKTTLDSVAHFAIAFYFSFIIGHCSEGSFLFLLHLVMGIMAARTPAAATFYLSDWTHWAHHAGDHDRDSVFPGDLVLIYHYGQWDHMSSLFFLLFSRLLSRMCHQNTINSSVRIFVFFKPCGHSLILNRNRE